MTKSLHKHKFQTRVSGIVRISKKSLNSPTDQIVWRSLQWADYNLGYRPHRWFCFSRSCHSPANTRQRRHARCRRLHSEPTRWKLRPEVPSNWRGCHAMPQQSIFNRESVLLHHWLQEPGRSARLQHL